MDPWSDTVVDDIVEETTEAKLETAEAALAYITAGKAKFTIRSKGTGNRFTYRVRLSDDEKVSFVSMMTGTDNETHFSYMGILRDGQFRRTAKSKVGEGSPGYMAFIWLWRQLNAGNLPDTVEVWHEGRCGRCGRTLTTPESIERGIGPECAQIMQSSNVVSLRR